MPPRAPVVLKAWDDSKARDACRSCRREIWWFELLSGKRHPFDAAADHGAPVYLQMTAEGDRTVAHISAEKSHFSTCPQSKQWKGKGA